MAFNSLRIDDFRCHDSSLVWIDPARIDEALSCARDLFSKGLIRGVYLKDDGYGVHPAFPYGNLNFLESFSFLDVFFFSASINKLAFNDFDYGILRNAKVVNINIKGVRVDVSELLAVESLSVRWFKGMDLSSIKSLRCLQLDLAGAECVELLLPELIENLVLYPSRCSSLLINSPLPNLRRLSLYHSRNLNDLRNIAQVASGLEFLEMECVSGGFDYECLSMFKNMRSLHVEKSSPISSWKFVKELNLERLVLIETACPMVSPSDEGFSNIPHLDIPKGRVIKPSEAGHLTRAGKPSELG